MANNEVKTEKDELKMANLEPASQAQEATEPVVETPTPAPVPTPEPVITKASVEAESNRMVVDAEKARKNIARGFKKQETVPISISPLYRPHFGNVMSVNIQGTLVTVPCDGRTYYVPKAFADEVKIRISNQDELTRKNERLSDVKNNFETSPGALRLY